MKKSLFAIINILYLMLASPVLSARDVSEPRTVRTQYYYVIPSHQSQDEAKRTAVERAKIEAVIEAFGGEEISQVNSVYIESGEQDVTDFQARMYNRVRGVWVRDLSAPTFVFHNDADNGMQALTVTVHGQVRERSAARFPGTVEPKRLGGHGNTTTVKFVSGDEMVLDFSVPLDGYCAVYLIDENHMANRILPIQYGAGAQAVKGQRRYLLADPAAEQSVGGYKDYCDSAVLLLNDGDRTVTNWIYVAYSPNKFTRLTDSTPTATSGDSDDILSVPAVEADVLEQWIYDCERHDDDFAVYRCPIYISPAK